MNRSVSLTCNGRRRVTLFQDAWPLHGTGPIRLPAIDPSAIRIPLPSGSADLRTSSGPRAGSEAPCRQRMRSGGRRVSRSGFDAAGVASDAGRRGMADAGTPPRHALMPGHRAASEAIADGEMKASSALFSVASPVKPSVATGPQVGDLVPLARRQTRTRTPTANSQGSPPPSPGGMPSARSLCDAATPSAPPPPQFVPSMPPATFTGKSSCHRKWAPTPLEVDSSEGVASTATPEAPLTCSTATSSPAAEQVVSHRVDLDGEDSDALPMIHGFNSWRKGRSIGSGSFAVVYRALDENGTIFAVKESSLEDQAGVPATSACGRLDRCQDGSEEDRRFRSKLEDELHICKSLRHPHIVNCLGHDYQDGRLFIYLEYVPGGSLAGILSEFGPLDGSMMHKGTVGLLRGLDYLHTCEPPVVHRDIKGANVLVGLDFCVKLADFGCSKRADVTRSFTTLGSVLWMAPEVIQQESGHGRKADLWSLGCTIIEMATAEKPWGNGVFDNLMAAVLHIGMSGATPPIPDTLPEQAEDLVRQCVRRDPKDRPWAGELLKHDYVCR